MKALHAVVLAFGMVFSGHAAADEAAERAAGELLDAMNMESSFEEMIDVALKAQLSGKPELAKHESVFRSFFSKHMSYASLKPKLAAAYAEEFTAAELAETAAFYRTPLGKKFIAKLPKLYARGGQIGQEAVRSHIPELVQMIKDAESASGSGSTERPVEP